MNSASQSAPLATEPAAPARARTATTPPRKAPKATPADGRARLTREQITELFLHELSHAERLLTILWYVERMSPDEIALAIDSTPELVRMSHASILQKLG